MPFTDIGAIPSRSYYNLPFLESDPLYAQYQKGGLKTCLANDKPKGMYVWISVNRRVHVAALFYTGRHLGPGIQPEGRAYAREAGVAGVILYPPPMQEIPEDGPVFIEHAQALLQGYLRDTGRVDIDPEITDWPKDVI